MRAWLDRLDADRDNMRAAIGFAVAAGDADTALAICADAVALLALARQRRRGARADARARSRPRGGPPALRQRALNGAGALAGEQGDFAAAKLLFEESLALARELGDDYRASRVVANLGSLALYARDYDEAIARYERVDGVLHARDRGHARASASMTQNLGIATPQPATIERAVELLEESVALARERRRPRAPDARRCARSRGSARRASDDPRARARPAARGAARSRTTSPERPGDRRDASRRWPRSPAAGAIPRTGALLIGAAERDARRGGDDAPARRGGLGARGDRRRCARRSARRRSRPRAPRARELELADVVARALRAVGLSAR